MKNKKQIKEDLRNVLFELEFNKFNIEKKKELKLRKKELEHEYKQILLEESKKTK